MKHQLEFIDCSENGNILVGTSQLVNSCNWTGDLWYFVKESDIASDNDVISSSNNKYLHYPLPISVSAGTFLNTETKLLVGNDIGVLAVYSTRENDDYYVDDHASTTPSINNDVCFAAHDRSILSLSVSNRSSSNPKAVTGSMDHCIQVWDIESFTREISYDSAHSHYVTCVRFQGCTSETGGSGAAFVSTALDGRCLLWDKRQKHPARVLHEDEEARFKYVEWFDDCAFSLFLGCESGKIRLIDTRNSKDAVSVHDFPHGRSINTMRSYSYNSKKYLSVCGDCRTLEVYHYDELLRKIYSNENHVDYVRDTVWIKNQGKLVSCSWDSKIIKHHPFLNIDSEEIAENTSINLEKDAISSETTSPGKAL